MLLEAVMRVFRIKDVTGWPAVGEIHVRQSPETGLPRVNWMESQMSSPQGCFVAIDRDGEARFVVRDAGSARTMTMQHTRMSLETRMQGLLVMLAFFALPIILALWRWRDYRFGDDTPPMMVFLGVLIYELILLGIGFFAYVLWRAIQMRTGKRLPEGETYASRPWSQLQGFRVSDERVEYGQVERGEDGRERQPGSLLLADFGTAAPPLIVTGHNWSLDVLAELHRVLTREFVECRSEHLARLAAADREARQASAANRDKVI